MPERGPGLQWMIASVMCSLQECYMHADIVKSGLFGSRGGNGNRGGKTYRLIHPRPRTHDLNLPSKLLLRPLEHAIQILPCSDVGLLEDGTAVGELGAAAMPMHKIFCFRPQREVGEEDVALAGEKEAREC